MVLLDFQRVSLEALAGGKHKFDRTQDDWVKGIIGARSDQHRELPAGNELLDQGTAELADDRRALGAQLRLSVDAGRRIDAQAVARMGGFHKEGEWQLLQSSRRIDRAGRLHESRKPHALGIGHILHGRLGRVIEPEARPGVWKVEGLQRPDDVDGGHVPLQVAFAQIDEDVEPAPGRLAKLLVNHRLSQEQVLDRALGQQAGQIPGGIEVPVANRGTAVVRL